MQRYVQSRMTRSLRDARPAVPRPLPRRNRGPAWPRAVSSLLLVALVAALAAALLDTAPLLTGRSPGALDLSALLPMRVRVRLGLAAPGPAAASGPRLTIVAGDRSWPLTAADLASMRPRGTAVYRGHGNALASAAAPAVDRAAVATYVRRRAGALDRAGRDAGVLYDGGVARVYRGLDGQVVDRAAATDRLVAALRQAGASGTATVTWPLVSGLTVTNGEARRMADELKRTLRTTVVWLPGRHWAITPAQIAAALTLERVRTGTTARLVARLDSAAIAARLPGSERLARGAARGPAVVVRAGRLVGTPAVAGRYPNYAALADEMLRSPPGRAVYHLPISVDQSR